MRLYAVGQEGDLVVEMGPLTKKYTKTKDGGSGFPQIRGNFSG